MDHKLIFFNFFSSQSQRLFCFKSCDFLLSFTFIFFYTTNFPIFLKIAQFATRNGNFPTIFYSKFSGIFAKTLMNFQIFLFYPSVLQEKFSTEILPNVFAYKNTKLSVSTTSIRVNKRWKILNISMIFLHHIRFFGLFVFVLRSHFLFNSRKTPSHHSFRNSIFSCRSIPIHTIFPLY